MALTSSIVPYLALLSLLVSCIPGAYWVCKKIARSRRVENSSRDQHPDRDSLPTNLQYSSSAILLAEYLCPSSGPLLRTVNNETRQFFSTLQQLPTSPWPFLDPEAQSACLNVTYHVPNMQGSVDLRAEQHWYIHSMWNGSPQERRSSHGVSNQFRS